MTTKIARSAGNEAARRAALALVACLTLGHGGTVDTSPACEEARRTNGWCQARGLGYVGSLEVRSKYLYETLDTHGHPILAGAVTCEVCRNALATDGYCPVHRMGYHGGLAFMSRLTYQLALARRIDPAAVTCPACRKNLRTIGWCDRHRVGMTGAFAVDDRPRYEALLEAWRITRKALDAAAACETCAAAMIADGYCSYHRLKYDGGRVVAAPASPEAPAASGTPARERP